MEENKSADYTGMSLVSGGLIYNLTSFLRRNGNEKTGRLRTALVLVIITWLTLCIIALFEGTLKDSAQTISFFEDFLTHIRLLFVVPFLIIIENLVDKSFVGYLQNTDRIIPHSQQGAYNQLVKRLNSLTNSMIPEALILLVFYGLVIINWNSLSIFNTSRNYLLNENSGSLAIGGWYYLIVCSPIFLMLVFRWLWRWLIWVYSIIRISRFKLELDPLHADRMAGLEYLNNVPLTLSYILIAPSALFSAHIGMEIIYQGASLNQYAIPISAYVFMLPIFLFAPLVLFLPKLIRTKSYGIQHFGNTIRTHNIGYRKRWIEGSGKEGDELLGTMDNSSLSDINGSYAPVQEMKLFPINLKMVLMSFVMNLIPYLPLIFTYYTISELFNDFLKTIIAT